MEILRTENTRTGARRYYLDGRRVTRSRMDAAKLWRRLDTVYTTIRNGTIRHYCHAREA